MVLPAMHMPVFDRDVAPGKVFCLRCEREITLTQWAGESCPGKAAAR